MTKMLITAQPGDLFVVPLKRGGFGLAIVARAADHRRARVRALVCFGFRHKYETMPTADQALSMQFSDCIHMVYCGDVNIRNGNWSIVARMTGFSKADWVIPPCVAPDFDCEQGRQVRDETVRRIELINDESLSISTIDNAGLIPPRLGMQFPCLSGMADSAYLAGSLDLAIRDRFPLHVFEVRSTTRELWLSIIAECKRRGLYPQ